MSDDLFHDSCFACGATNSGGLHLQFTHDDDGTIGTVVIDNRFHGYKGVVHGGVIATIMDAAMVRCLQHAFGGNPFTCKLEVRYLNSLPVDTPLAVAARVIKNRGNMYWAESQIHCGEVLCVRASGTFRIKT
jgi:acyl-coenzyme A thioesterase PaaI-like protein